MLYPAIYTEAYLVYNIGVALQRVLGHRSHGTVENLYVASHL